MRTKSAVCIVKVQRNLGILGEGNAYRQIVLIYNEDRSLIGEVKLSKKQFKEVFDDDELKAYWEAEVFYKGNLAKPVDEKTLEKETDGNVKASLIANLRGHGVTMVVDPPIIKHVNFIRKVKAQKW